MKLRRNQIDYREGSAIDPSNATKANVEQYAGRVAELTSFNVGQHPSELVQLLGGRVHFQHTDEWLDEDGSIFVHGEADFDILLPAYTSPLRDRFTIAHELGHYFLHAQQGQAPIIAYRSGSTRIEWEANWFAAALLMPRKQFTAACKKSSSLAVIASKFGVSQDAARVRREALCT